MSELVERYEGPLFRYLLRMVGEVPLAEDLFQETFLRLHRYRARFRRGAHLKPYLYRIAANVARDAISARHSRPKRLSLNGGRGAAPLGETLPGRSPDPRAAGEAGELRFQVRAAMAALPDVEREVVHLRVFDNLTFHEIAHATGVPVSTAKSRMVYAIRRLRPVLERYLSGGPEGGN